MCVVCFEGVICWKKIQHKSSGYGQIKFNNNAWLWCRKQQFNSTHLDCSYNRIMYRHYPDKRQCERYSSFSYIINCSLCSNFIEFFQNETLSSVYGGILCEKWCQCFNVDANFSFCSFRNIISLFTVFIFFIHLSVYPYYPKEFCCQSWAFYLILRENERESEKDGNRNMCVSTLFSMHYRPLSNEIYYKR